MKLSDANNSFRVETNIFVLPSCSTRSTALSRVFYNTLYAGRHRGTNIDNIFVKKKYSDRYSGYNILKYAPDPSLFDGASS